MAGGGRGFDGWRMDDEKKQLLPSGGSEGHPRGCRENVAFTWAYGRRSAWYLSQQVATVEGKIHESGHGDGYSTEAAGNLAWGREKEVKMEHKMNRVSYTMVIPTPIPAASFES